MLPDGEFQVVLFRLCQHHGVVLVPCPDHSGPKGKNEPTAIYSGIFSGRELMNSQRQPTPVRAQTDATDLLNAVMNMFFEAQNVGSGRFATIHDRQSIFAGDANPLNPLLKPNARQATETLCC
jgi:hypothetical protein